MDEGENIHGPINEVIKKLLDEVTNGDMSADQFAELIQGLAHQGGQRHDVSVPFRVALIAQGHEDMALAIGTTHMAITTAGALFEYGVRGDDTNWMDNLTPEQNAAMLQASVWVLRGGNINASLCPDDPGRIRIDGTITNDDEDEPDVEAIVSEFLREFDEEFPDKPKPRTGEWW